MTDAHGIGEQRIGEGRNIKDIIYIRVGYSIGSCIIINEKLFTGEDNLAGASGHIIVDPKGPVCEDCGNNGCLEKLASRRAIESILLQRYKEGETTVLAEKLSKEPFDINSAFIADAIDQEDALTCQVIEEAAEMLGIAITNVINILNPRTIILGGDVVNEIDLYFEKAVETAKKRSLHTNIKKCFHCARQTRDNGGSLWRGCIRKRTTIAARGIKEFPCRSILYGMINCNKVQVRYISSQKGVFLCVGQ